MLRSNLIASFAAMAALFGGQSAHGQYPFKPEPREPRHRTRKAGKVKRARSGGFTIEFIDPYQASVNRLTNWQRNQWARAGAPRDKVGAFLALEHPKRRRTAKAAA